MMIHATARTVGPYGFRAAPAGGRPGFSLTELLIAIGVLGIGLGMIAALFVTGLAQVRLSLGDSEGGMVAANGLAVAKMFLRAGNDVSSGTATDVGTAITLTDTGKVWVVDGYQGYHVEIREGTGSGQVRVISTNDTNVLTVSPPWNVGEEPDPTSQYAISTGVPSESLVVMADENDTTVINADFQKYPYADATTKKGFVILARRAGGAGAYQLVSVAYTKSGTGAVSAQTVTGSTATTEGVTTLTVTAGGDNLKAGSPVIVAATGEYATIVSVGTGTAELDHALTMDSGTKAYVIVEANAGSPATGVCITKTGLRP